MKKKYTKPNMAVYKMESRFSILAGSELPSNLPFPDFDEPGDVIPLPPGFPPLP